MPHSVDNNLAAVTAPEQYRLIDVCVLVGVSEETIRRWVRVGMAPRPLSIGPARRVRWDRAVIDRWLRDGRPKSA
jgi:predicted DNA-binding transcriptional regulator AlpA